MFSPLVVALVLWASLAGYAQQVAGIAGDYTGSLGTLHLRLHIKVDKRGLATGTLDSIDQGAVGIPCTDFRYEGKILAFAVPTVNGSWKGTVSAEGATLSGTWDQGEAQPLEFKRE